MNTLTQNTFAHRVKALATAKPVAIAVVCTVAITLRLALFLAGPANDPKRAFYGDSSRYIELADNLRTYGSFAIAGENAGVVHIPLAKLRADRGETEPLDPHGLKPEILRTPGYPAFIAALYKANLPFNALLIIQCIISTLTITLVYLLGKRLFASHRTALVAATLVALNPINILVANGVLSETLFTATMFLGLWLAVAFGQRNTFAAGGSGLILGLSVLVRPVTVMLGPAIALWMLATDRRLKTILPALAITACSLLPAAGWAARNESVGFGYRLSSIPYISNLFYTGAYMHIARNGLDTRSDWPATVTTLFDELETSTQPGEDVFAAMNRLTFEKITANPALYTQVFASSMIKLMTDHSVTDLYRTLGWEYQPTGLRDRLMRGDWSLSNTNNAGGLIIALGWTAINALFAAATFAGLIYLAATHQWKPLLLLGGVMLYFLLTTQALGLERLRVPIVGLQAICVATLVTPRRGRQAITTTRPLTISPPSDHSQRAAAA